MKRHLIKLMIMGLCFALGTAAAASPETQGKVTVNWEKVLLVSKTTPTLQVVVNPPLRRNSSIHDRVFQKLQELGCDYVRYVPWLPYPKLGIAELEPPRNGETAWDFSLIDPLTTDFLNATAGHSVILNFSIIPQWMFKTEQSILFPSDPNQVTWDYQQGTELRDPSGKEVADYYARLVRWYTEGKFTDEYGKSHQSGHHFKIDYWEVFNEVDFEHQMTPETYTKVYDAVVEALHGIQPQMKFVAMGLAAPSKNPRYFEYFLDPKNHKTGIPLDMISYHFYASPSRDETMEMKQFTFFEQADHFLDVVRYIEAIRQRLSPATRTTINEIGSIDSSDFDQGSPVYVYKPLPPSYWNLSGAVYAYVYSELVRQGIDVAGESQLVGYPTQFPSVSMVDWNTGQPNARYWVLKLLRDNLGPGDKLVYTDSTVPYVYSQGFLTREGKRKVLLVNKRDREFELVISGAAGAEVRSVDQKTGFQPPSAARIASDQVSMGGLAVMIVTLPN